MVRLGEVLDGPAMLLRGIWPTYLLAPAAVAGVAARLLELDEERSAHALAIALALAPPSVGRQSGASMSRWLAIGNAARSGVSAALAAQSGFTGDLRLFEGEVFLGVYWIQPRLELLPDEIEANPAVALTGFKPWCAARQTMAAVQALREIIAVGVAPADMTKLVVSVPFPYLKMIDHGVVPGDRTSYLTSVSYQMALYAFDPDASLDPRQVREAMPPEMKQLMERTSVKADEDLLRHYPNAWPALVSVETPRVNREKLVLYVPGDPERAFDEFQVAAKFWRLVGPLIGERRTEVLLRLCFASVEKDGSSKALLEAVESAVAQAEKA
jgi:2-methylcitrate dehydratase PrpD